MNVSKDILIEFVNFVNECCAVMDHDYVAEWLNKPHPKGSPTVIKKDSKNNKDKNKNIAPPTPRPSIVKVPSRRPKIDPKVIQKGLEYIDRIDDKEKREYILKRLEGLQSGQNNLDRKIDTNERRRQYDERRRDK